MAWYSTRVDNVDVYYAADHNDMVTYIRGHKTEHESGGIDAIPLDTLSAPTDITTLDVSIAAHGLCPKLPNDVTKFLSGTGTWVAVSQDAISPAQTGVEKSDVPVKGGVFNGGFELAPPFTAVQTTSSVWIDGTAAGSATVDKYGWNLYIATGTAAGSFDSTVSHSGKYSLKLSNTNATGTSYATNSLGATLPNLSKWTPLLKASTKYRFTIWIKTNTAAADAVWASIYQYDIAAVAGTVIASTKYTGTNDWTQVVTEFTSDADVGGSYARVVLWNFVASATLGDVWFDDITLEEIVEDTTFTGTIPTPVRPTVVGVTTTDNIDQSLDSGWAAAQHYDLPIAVDEGATHRQTFTPTRNKVTNIAIKTVLKGTGDWTLIVHEAANVVLAAQKIVNASLANATVTTFNVPNLWASGALHFHVISTVADGTVLTTTVHDLETVSYIQYYAKPTENVTVICNGEKISLSADQDGLLSGAIVDLDKGKYLYDSGVIGTTYAFTNDFYSADAGGITTAPIVINGWGVVSGNIYTNTVAIGAVIKVNTLVPCKHLKVTYGTYADVTYQTRCDISTDGVNFTKIVPSIAAGAETILRGETDLAKGLSTFYLKFVGEAGKVAIIGRGSTGIKIEADLDTSTVPSIILQPLATQPAYSFEFVLPSSASRVYFYKSTYANKKGIIMPHLVFTDGSAVIIKKIPLEFDNNGEANPCVILLPGTTNFQLSGGGASFAESTVNWGMNDAGFMTFSAGTTSGVINYKMGTGTVSPAGNITYNRLYLSSNGVANSATKDPSHQFNFYLGMLKEGVQKVVEKLQGAVNDISKAIHREYGERNSTFPDGCVLTTTYALVSLAAFGAVEIYIPDTGIYEVTAQLYDDPNTSYLATGIWSMYCLYVDGVAQKEYAGFYTKHTAVCAGVFAGQQTFMWFVNSTHPNTLCQIYGKTVGTPTAGTWTCYWGRISYKRIA